MKTRRSQASLHSKCDKTIGGKVLIAAPAARQAYRQTEADPILASAVSKRSSFTISSNVFIGKENSAAGLQPLNGLGGNIFIVQVQITESFSNTPRAL